MAQREKQKAALAPHRVLRNGYAKKMAVAIFSLRSAMTVQSKNTPAARPCAASVSEFSTIPDVAAPRRRDGLYSHKKSSGGARAAVRKTSKKFNLVSLSYKVHISSSYDIFLFISYYV